MRYISKKLLMIKQSMKIDITNRSNISISVLSKMSENSLLFTKRSISMQMARKRI